MVTNSHAYGPALSQACKYVRRHPKLPILARTEGLGQELLANFMREREVKAWLRTCPYRRWHELTRDLLDKAYSYLFEGDEAKRVHALYSDQRRAGLLDNLRPTVRAIHRAIMMLAIEMGTPVLGATRYVAVVLRHEFGLITSPATVGRALHRLHDLHLIDYTAGSPGLRAQSGQIRLVMPQTPAEPDTDAVIDLSLSDETRMALADFRRSARKSRADRYDNALSSRKALVADLFADYETERTSGVSDLGPRVRNG